MKFFFDSYSFSSAGAVAALVQGLVVKELWRRGMPRPLARAPPSPAAPHRHRLDLHVLCLAPLHACPLHMHTQQRGLREGAPLCWRECTLIVLAPHANNLTG